MPSAESSPNMMDFSSVRVLIQASVALDAILGRSYTPEAMSPEYARFHQALEPFMSQEGGE